MVLGKTALMAGMVVLPTYSVTSPGGNTGARGGVEVEVARRGAARVSEA